jgi:hypothetical protein
MKNPCFPCLGLAMAGLAVGLGGCASTAQRTASIGGEKVLTQNFRWVYVTGSHIPVAVPIDPNVKTLTGVSPLNVITPDEIRRWGGPMH